MLAAEDVWREMGKHEPTCTSANDGKHMEGSKHYSDEALDIRIWQMVTKEYPDARDAPLVKQAARRLQIKLGEDYDVVVEKDHIHVEYDPECPLRGQTGEL